MAARITWTLSCSNVRSNHGKNQHTHIDANYAWHRITYHPLHQRCTERKHIPYSARACFCNSRSELGIRSKSHQSIGCSRAVHLGVCRHPSSVGVCAAGRTRLEYQQSHDNRSLIRSGEARLVGWSRQTLYPGFSILYRSVFWSANLNGRSDNLDVIPLALKATTGSQT